jgi:recombinational DNA repair ATPase RecF
MDDVLLGVVLDRLNVKPLPVEAADLLLAALDGDAALSAQLNADPAGRYMPSAAAGSAKDPVGAYLRSVTVTGFRGIGPSAMLEIAPGPGLTLVVGRNGSGKSSFAEALEVLLTGTLMRWADAPLVVREGWRSKHAAGDIEITAEFLIEGSGKATVTRTWSAGAPGADPSASKAWLQRAGDKRTDMSDLGWDADLREYRPFLSHAELEAFFGKPSELHDLLASVLGLDDLTAADKRLNAARKGREDALGDVKKRLEPLRATLELLAEHDERARQCLAALSGVNPAKNWDLIAAKAAVTGGEPVDGGQLAALRRLAQLSSPPSAEVDAAVTGLRDAAAALRDVAGTSAEQARDLARLLEAALGHHLAHGDGDCPVCGNPGALSGEWRQSTSQHLDRLRAQATAAEEAFAAARRAANRALMLLQPVPSVLMPAALRVGQEPGTDVAGLNTTSARTAWAQWASPVTGQGRAAPDSLATPDALTVLAQHLETAYPVLVMAVTELAEAAAKELAHRDDQWAPVAAQVAAWCADAELALAGNQPVVALRQARKWLAEATADLRDQRLAPLADESRAVWAELRQESNVGLSAFRLSGANTQRRLELDVSIDGEPGAALGVMSQGEINALALSIFLPRATMPDSPFNFLVIDDPVQAMDPAKVDGLAKVLAKVAKDRQVIVFTHDNRLAAAVKDLSIPATILEVTRQPQSRVTVRECLDASEQALKDAGAVNADQKVPAAVAERVVPGLCRTAVEAAFAQAFWRQQLRDGRTRADIEAAIEGKKLKLVNIAALALSGDPDRGTRVISDIERQWGRPFANTIGVLNRGTHEGHRGDLGRLISDSRRLVAKIEDELR